MNRSAIPPRHPWVLGSILVLASLAVALVLAEVVVRLVAPQRIYFNISQWHPYVGFAAIPNLQSVQRNREYAMAIRINSRGLRDREFSPEKPPGTLRVGVFGDSFTFGEGVAAEEAYPKLLEQRFARDPRFGGAGRRVEVLNFGLGKTGTSHQLAWYQAEGRRYGLDVVVVGFLPANDFGDNLSGVFRWQEGQLVHDPAAYSSLRRIQSVVYAIPGYRWLAENSHLLNLVRVTATRLDDRDRAAKRERAATPGPAQDAYAVELTFRLLEAFVRETRADGSDLVLLNLPTRAQVPLDQVDPEAPPKPYLGRLRLLRDRLATSGLDWIDLGPAFAALPVNTYYYEFDGHWRPAGHRVVAEVVYEPLAALLAARAGPDSPPGVAPASKP